MITINEIRFKLAEWLLPEDYSFKRELPSLEVQDSLQGGGADYVSPVEQEPKKKHNKKTKRKRKVGVIKPIYGTYSDEGVVKKDKRGYCAYAYRDRVPKRAYGTKKECIQIIDKFRECGYSIQEWENILLKVKGEHYKRKYRLPMYMYLKQGVYTLQKNTVQGEAQLYGVYSNYENALAVLKYLVYVDWNEEYSAKKMGGKQERDSMYYTLKPLMSHPAYQYWLEYNEERLKRELKIPEDDEHD